MYEDDLYQALSSHFDQEPLLKDLAYDDGSTFGTAVHTKNDFYVGDIVEFTGRISRIYKLPMQTGVKLEGKVEKVNPKTLTIRAYCPLSNRTLKFRMGYAPI